MHRPLPSSVAAFAVALLLLAPSAGAEPRLYGVSRDDGALRIINPDTGVTFSTITMLDISAQQAIQGCNSLATNPCDGRVWILYRRTNEDNSVRRLGTLMPGTGQITHVRQLNIRIAAIAFDADGALYGITGNGETTDPEALYILSTENGSRARLAGYGPGDDGEALAFNPVDRRLYRMSGRGELNSPAEGPVLDAIDLNTLAATQVTINGLPQTSDEITSMTFRKATNSFIIRTRDNQFWRITATGAASFISVSDHYNTGLAFAEPDAAGALYAAPRDGAFLNVLDPTTGDALDTFAVNLPGFAISGFNGLATNPCTGEIFAIVRTKNERVLATIDQDTGEATLRGAFARQFAGVAFDTGGTLFGVTGNDGVAPETLFMLGQAGGAPGLFLPLTPGGDGEAIAYYPPLRWMFRASGIGAARKLWAIDTLSISQFELTLAPFGTTEIAAMVYWPGEAVFLCSSIHGDFIRLLPGGLESLISVQAHYKGLAFARPRSAAAACPSDINGDGAVTAADLAQVLGAWGPCP